MPSMAGGTRARTVYTGSPSVSSPPATQKVNESATCRNSNSKRSRRSSDWNIRREAARPPWSASGAMWISAPAGTRPSALASIFSVCPRVTTSSPDSGKPRTTIVVARGHGTFSRSRLRRAQTEVVAGARTMSARMRSVVPSAGAAGRRRLFGARIRPARSASESPAASAMTARIMAGDSAFSGSSICRLNCRAEMRRSLNSGMRPSAARARSSSEMRVRRGATR